MEDPNPPRIPIEQQWSKLKKKILESVTDPEARKGYIKLFKLFDEKLTASAKAIQTAARHAANGDPKAVARYRDALTLFINRIRDYRKTIDLLRAGWTKEHPMSTGSYTFLERVLARMENDALDTLYKLQQLSLAPPPN